MALIAFTACSGAPGTTTLAHALAGAWPRRALLVEADPDGGRLAARCGLPLRPGLVDLAALTRSGHVAANDLARVAQRSAEGVDLLVAHPDPDQVRALLRSSAPRLAMALGRLDDLDVLVDIGRLRPDSEAGVFLDGCHQLVLVSGTRLEDIASVVHRRGLLDAIAARVPVGLVVTAPGEHAAAEAAHAMGVDLLGVRPGRSGRRDSERSRRRESAWIGHLATDVARRVTERSTKPEVPTSRPIDDVDVEVLDPVLGAPVSIRREADVFAVPSGPRVPGPTPLVDLR